MSDCSVDSSFPDMSNLYLWNMLPDKKSRTCFHMPGHLSGSFFPDEYFRNLIMSDTTELPSTDDLHDPTGPALHAAQTVSRCYGSGKSFFVTTGSTTGIRVMMASVCDDETFFLFPRSVHISVLYTAAMLDFPYAFIKPKKSLETDSYLIPVITAESVEAAIIENPKATDILLVSPDYYGRCADIEAIASVVHRYGRRLLVDEAHGSHLPFCPPGSPMSAIRAGADLSVMSVHKTLPAMTMASLIHISSDALLSGRVQQDRVFEMLRTFETSSPSFSIAASSEYAIAWAQRMGERAIRSTIDCMEIFYRKLSKIPGVSPIIGSPYETDPLRMVLSIDHPGISARQVSELLSEQGIDIEFSDLKRLVLIVSPGQRPMDFDRLYSALSGALTTAGSVDPIFEENLSLDGLENLWKKSFEVFPDRSTTVRKAFFFGKRKSVLLEDALGAVVTVPVSPYPPGIPVLWPGEVITKTHIFLLSGLLTNGMTVSGVHNGYIQVKN